MRPFEAIRAEIEASNTKLDTMIEAHHQLIAALTALAQQMAHPIVQTAPQPPFKGFGGADQTMGQAGSPIFNMPPTGHATPQQQTTLGSTSDTMPGMRRVPRGTPEDHTASGEMPQIAPIFVDPPHLEENLAGGYDPNSLSDMHAELLDELAEAEDDQDLLPEPDEDGLWQKRLSMHALRLWQPDWGPRPGQEGCRVPQHLMNGRA